MKERKILYVCNKLQQSVEEVQNIGIEEIKPGYPNMPLVGFRFQMALIDVDTSDMYTFEYERYLEWLGHLKLKANKIKFIEN